MNVQVPPIKIQGIKTKAIPFIRESIQWNRKGKWIEPFVGSVVVPLNIRPERALLSDSNPHLIALYQRIQEGEITSASVRDYLEREGEHLLRKGENHYYEIRERFNNHHNSHDFLFLNRACFNGLIRFNKSGRFNTPFCRKPKRFRPAYITKICNQVQWASDTMEGLDWKFICADWHEILTRVDSNDFVYADPPYAGRHTDYFNTWSDEDGKILEDKLKSLSCPFLYSMWSENKYRKNERLHQSFSKYEIKTFSHFYHLGSSESLRNGMTEALVIG